MKRFKKWGAVVLAMACFVSMTGCGKKKEDTKKETTEQVVDTSSEASEKETTKETVKVNKEIDPATLKAGDSYFLGKYEQDGDTGNGAEDIEWIVLSVEDGKVLLISKYGLDAKAFQDFEGPSHPKGVTWENCSLRKWMNNDFFNTAFSDEEKAMIPEVTLVNSGNEMFGTPAQNDTKDKVFCLSIEEVQKYFGESTYTMEDGAYSHYEKTICIPTQNAINNHVTTYAMDEYTYGTVYEGNVKYSSFLSKEVVDLVHSEWWLRTPGSPEGEYDGSKACFVGTLGAVGFSICNDVEFPGYAVRPAIYIEVAAKAEK